MNKIFDNIDNLILFSSHFTVKTVCIIQSTLCSRQTVDRE